MSRSPRRNSVASRRKASAPALMEVAGVRMRTWLAQARLSRTGEFGRWGGAPAGDAGAARKACPRPAPPRVENRDYWQGNGIVQPGQAALNHWPPWPLVPPMFFSIRSSHVEKRMPADASV